MNTPSFTCPTCARVSYHHNDALYQYCGYCHTFPEDREFLKLVEGEDREFRKLVEVQRARMVAKVQELRGQILAEKPK